MQLSIICGRGKNGQGLFFTRKVAYSIKSALATAVEEEV